jgi:hypothetical protein
MFMRFSIVRLPIALILLFSFAACNKSNPVGPGSSSGVQPKIGSSFTYFEYSIDTTTGQVVPGSTDTSVETVAKTGMSYSGKSNVTMVVSSSIYGLDTSYINYESNGDISSVFSLGFMGSGSSWITIPVASKATNTIALYDTTTYLLGVPTETKASLTASFVDNETVMVGSQSLSVEKIELLVTGTTTTLGVTQTQNIASYGYYAPSIGYIVKSLTPSFVDVTTGTKQEGNGSTLLSYILK